MKVAFDQDPGDKFNFYLLNKYIPGDINLEENKQAIKISTNNSSGIYNNKEYNITFTCEEDWLSVYEGDPESFAERNKGTKEKF